MKNVFYKSVIGASHLKKNARLEDCSYAFYDENTNSSVICVSDGHGDPKCLRSHLGAKFAAEIASTRMLQLAKWIRKNNVLSSISVIKPRLHQDLSENLIHYWKEMCIKDFEKNPIPGITSLQEIIRLYGATLVCVLKIDDIFICVQQGDGSIVFVLEDGTSQFPVALDARCVNNVTTSLCDADAESSFVLEIFKMNLDGILMSAVMSDGIVDSFYDRSMLSSYMAELCQTFVKNIDKNVYFEEELSSLSKKGSQDDVSIACMYNKEKILKNIDVLISFVQDKSFELEKQKAIASLSSKERKKTILEKRILKRQKEINKSSRELLQKKIEEVKEWEKYFTDLRQSKKLQYEKICQMANQTMEKQKLEFVFEDIENVRADGNETIVVALQQNHVFPPECPVDFVKIFDERNRILNEIKNINFSLNDCYYIKNEYLSLNELGLSVSDEELLSEYQKFMAVYNNLKKIIQNES